MAEKKYVIDNAELMAEWDWDKNGELKSDPKTLTLGCGQKVWWKCKKGHRWSASIINRSKRGSGCPYCSGKKPILGETDLETINPELTREWHPTRNQGLTPRDVVAGSHTKVWWKCKNGHEWQADIKSRNLGNGCPYCSGRYPVKGENDLQTVNPSLAKEWNYEKNNGLTPIDVLPNSGKKVWWKCSKGHEWHTTIDGRNKGHGCPYCAGQKVIKGENDLKTVNPTLAREWHYKKNNGLTPEDVLPNSGKKVWWKCSKGHEWQAKIYHRNTVSDCPICHSERNTSLPEYAIIFYLKKYGLEIIHSYKEKGYELDVYIPSKKIAIEYDGYFWHKNKTQEDLEKNRKCKRDGIILYRIREGLSSLNDCSIDYVIQKNHKDFSETLVKVLSDIIGKPIHIDLAKDAVAIENLREYIEKENSLLHSNPELSKEWNYEKNGKLKPEHFSANSGKKVWWRCSKGHEWQATMNSRNRGRGCPYCSGLFAIKGENDLQTVNPSLAKEWDYKNNNGLTPMEVLPNSEKKVWWKCDKGHEWQAIIGNRNKGQGCPYCSGRYAVKGENDLQTVNPKLANEWNFEKNDGLTPLEVLPNSNKKVWWKCKNGHEWQARIVDRNKGRSCPYCSGKKVLKGFNDLQTVNPTLAAEWHYEKNNGLTAADVTPNSHVKVWWKCSKGHEWQALIYNRQRGNGCPICRKEKRL